MATGLRFYSTEHIRGSRGAHIRYPVALLVLESLARPAAGPLPAEVGGAQTRGVSLIRYGRGCDLRTGQGRGSDGCGGHRKQTVRRPRLRVPGSRGSYLACWDIRSVGAEVVCLCLLAANGLTAVSPQSARISNARWFLLPPSAAARQLSISGTATIFSDDVRRVGAACGIIGWTHDRMAHRRGAQVSGDDTLRRDLYRSALEQPAKTR